MASNGRVGLRSGSPSFLVVGLSLVIIVLLYSYWSVSSRNSMLLRDQSFLHDRLRSLTSQKLAAEKKKTSFMAQLSSMEKTKRQLEGNVASSSKQKTELNSRISALELSLEQEKKKAATLQSQQSKSKAELQKLKGEIDQTTEKLKQLTNKANSFVDMYKRLKETLADKNDELLKVQNQMHLCQVKLKSLKEEHPAPEGNVDNKKKIELPRGNAAHKQGMLAQHKRRMQLASTKPPAQPKANTGPDSEGQEVTKGPKYVTQSNVPTGKLTVASGKQSGNDTNKAASPNNATAAVTSTGSTNTTTITTIKQVENKPNMTKPAKNQDDNSPENKESKSDDTESESKEKTNEDEVKNDNLLAGPRAQPIGLEFPKRSTSDRERRRLR